MVGLLVLSVERLDLEDYGLELRFYYLLDLSRVRCSGLPRSWLLVPVLNFCSVFQLLLKLCLFVGLFSELRHIQTECDHLLQC